MKKTLLTLAAVAMTASASWADQTTFVFDGDNQMWGYPRLEKLPTANDIVKAIQGEQEGVEFDLKVANESDGNFGYAFIHVSNSIDQQGIALYQKTESNLTLSVPGGKITAVTMYMSGGAINGTNTGCTIAGKSYSAPTAGPLQIDPSDTKKFQYAYSWSDANGLESVVINPLAYNFGNSRCIRSIEVTYQPALGDKQPSGLAFNSENVDYIFGNTFTAPTLSNPNNLDITWSSSNEEVATVDENGDVNFTGTPGSTTITASTDGNDDFAKGTVSYKVNVTGNAKNVKELSSVSGSMHSMPVLCITA